MREQQKSVWQKVRSFVRGYRREYFDYLYYQYRFVNMKGITSQGVFNLEQPEVFVNVDLAQADSGELITGIVSPSTRKYENSQKIWSYLGNQTGSGNKLVVVGSPGSGKTTLLKQIVLAFCRFRSAYGLPGKIPVILFLRNHIPEIIREPDVRLVKLIADSMARFGMECKEQWFERRLKKGQSVVLLDGLDEIGENDYREKVVRWIEKQLIAYPGNHFIVTSRPHGITNLVVTGAEILQILPLEFEHIEKFIEDWYWATERRLSRSEDIGIRRMASEGAQDLLSRIQNTESLHPLARNALLLTMIATLHRFDAQLPGRRVELYDAIFKIFFRRREALGVDLLTAEQSKSVLQPLARFMMEKASREIGLAEAVHIIQKDLAEIGGEQIRPVEFLRTIQDQSGLLLEVAENEFSFASLTFQEYLASVDYVERQKAEFLVQKIKNPWWAETVRLFCAQTDGTRIIEACLADDPIRLEQLQLAISCLEEALRVEVGVRSRLNEIIRQGVDHPEPKWRNVIATALLFKRLRFMDRIDARRLIDTGLVTNVEYQIFLDHEAERGHYYHPDHWIDCRFASGKALEPVAGVRMSDVQRFCEWLIPQDIWRFRYRLPEDRETTIHKCEVDGYQYWLSDGEAIQTSEARRDVSPRYKDLIIEQIVEDAELFTAVRAAAEREKTAPKTSDLLETALPIEGRSGGSSFDVSTDARIAEIQKGEMVRVREWYLLQHYREFAVRLNIDLEQFLDCITVVNVTNKDQVQSFDWLPVFPYPPEYGFDFGKEIQDFVSRYPESRLRAMLEKKFLAAVQVHELLSQLMLNRTWTQATSITDNEREDVYAFLRSMARISLLTMAIAGKARQPSLSRDIANLYLIYCLLERRIAGKEKPVEGVRLVKFS
jgi:hypothetical protein